MKRLRAILLMAVGLVLVAVGVFYTSLNLLKGVQFSNQILTAAWISLLVGAALFWFGVTRSPPAEVVSDPPTVPSWLQWCYLVLGVLFLVNFFSVALYRLPSSPAKSAWAIGFGLLMFGNSVRLARTVISANKSQSIADAVSWMGFGAALVGTVMAIAV